MSIHKKLYSVHNNIKIGWQNFSLYFYVTGISVIIGGFFKIAGAVAFIATLCLFYAAGRFHQHAEERLKA